jgi:hypothetical protein
MADEVKVEVKGVGQSDGQSDGLIQLSREADKEVDRQENQKKSRKSRKAGWLWPVGVVATSLAGAGLLVLRGCWHRRMSWPVRAQGYSYQVCLSCGVKRLFDEKRFCSYGPFRYDLTELIAREKANREDSIADRHLERPAS